MAGITDLQYKLMESQSKGYPEFDAGLYPYKASEPLYYPPSGPLRNIDPTLVPEGKNYYELDWDENTDPDLASYSEWPYAGETEQVLNVDLIPENYKHSLKGHTTSELGGLSYGAKQEINPILMKHFGTFPVSPRNEGLMQIEGINTGLPHGWTDQTAINKEVINVLAHEVGHGLSKQRGFKNILGEAEGMEVGYGPHKLSKFDLSELYNRALDMERQEIIYPKDEDDEDWWNSEWYASKRHIDNVLGSEKAANSYLKQVKPLVNKYFNQVGKHKKYKKSYESGRAPGHWYHGLDYEGGAAGNVTQAGPGRQEDPGGGAFLKAPPKTITPRHAPDPDRGGGPKRGSMPTGTAGRNPFGYRAKGGLIDIPLPGRSRDI